MRQGQPNQQRPDIVKRQRHQCHPQPIRPITEKIVVLIKEMTRFDFKDGQCTCKDIQEKVEYNLFLF